MREAEKMLQRAVSVKYVHGLCHNSSEILQ